MQCSVVVLNESDVVGGIASHTISGVLNNALAQSQN